MLGEEELSYISSGDQTLRSFKKPLTTELKVPEWPCGVIFDYLPKRTVILHACGSIELYSPYDGFCVGCEDVSVITSCIHNALQMLCTVFVVHYRPKSVENGGVWITAGHCTGHVESYEVFTLSLYVFELLLDVLGPSQMIVSTWERHEDHVVVVEGVGDECFGRF